jgi:hypothetical protein
MTSSTPPVKTAITCPSSKILSLFYCIVLAIGSESNIKYKCPKIKCQKIVLWCINDR